MSRKILAALLALLLLVTAVSLVSCGGTGDDFKVAVILVGDETEGYTKAHMDGINAAAAKLGIKDSQIIWKKFVKETSDCLDAAEDLVDQGCNLVISNSYGHQTFMAEAAKKYPDVTFIAMTGDFAEISGLPNLCNAFTRVYESRYVSGVVAGLKLKELVDTGKVSKTATPNAYDGEDIRIGYVGAYPYAEVVSGYTAFYLGLKSIVSNVKMTVKYTGRWFHFEDEKTTANALIDLGCVIIGQHADSEGAPTACETANKAGKVVYSVGYNVDMLAAAPTAALTSATNTWEVYYEYALGAAMKGEKIAQNWAEGYNKNAVNITALGTSCAAGTQDKVNEVVAAIKAGTLRVFDTNSFTVGGAKVTTAEIDLSYYDFSTGAPVLVYSGDKKEAIKDGYFDESTFRSAPYFALRIDGIVELD